MTDRSQNVDFVLDEFIEFWDSFKFLKIHLFDCKTFFGNNMLCLINLTELSVPYDIIKDIVINLFHW